MASEIRSAGLASGLPVNDIIEQLSEASRAPIRRIEAKKAQNEAKKTALQFVSAQTLNLSLMAFDLTKTATFDTKKVSSSNESVLTATANSSAGSGSYTFKVGQIAQASQVMSQGVATKDATPIGAGKISISLGQNRLNEPTELGLLNGGKGVQSGSIRLSDDKGNAVTVDLSTALTVNDVIDKINSADGMNVRASLSENGESIKLVHQNGNNLKVSEVNGGQVALDLGLLGSSETGEINGKDIVYVSKSTSLDDINDGLGLEITAKGITDLVINRIKGNKEVETINVDLDGSKTVGDILDKINKAVGEEGYAYLSEGSNGIQFKHDDFKFVDADKNNAATQLGIVGVGQREGRLVSGINDTLLRNLNGSGGVKDGEFNVITIGKNGKENIETIRVDATSSVQDLIKGINANKKSTVEATLNKAGNGLQLNVISDADNLSIKVENGLGFNTADELGLAGESVIGTLDGDNVHRRKVNGNTLVSALNGGKGIGNGKFEIQLSNGTKQTVEINSNVKTLKDVVTQIQGKFSKSTELKVEINENGDGLSIVDLSGGPDLFRIVDKDDVKTAASLNIAQTANSKSGKIDGTRDIVIDVAATDTLEDIATKISKISSLDLKASIVNDGTSRNAYRLNIQSNQSGAAYNLTIDSKVTGFDFSTTAQGLDSVVSFGSSQGNSTPITLTSSSLTIDGGISGISLNLKGVSKEEVRITVDRETEAVKEKLTEFKDKFNDIITNIKNLTKFVPPEELKDKINTGKEEGEEDDAVDAASGLLLGNSTLRRIQNDLYGLVSGNVEGVRGNIRTFSQVGLSMGSDGFLTFDGEKFDEVFSQSPEEVIDVFTLSQDVMNRNTNRTSVSIGGGLKLSSGFSLNNMLDGITTSSAYSEDGSGTGAKFSGKGYIDFHLDEVRSIKKLVLNQVNNALIDAANDGLQKFKFQYKDSTGSFVDINQFFHNNDGRSSYTLPLSVSTNTIRVEVLDGNPDSFSLLGLEAYESKGNAFQINDRLKVLTNAETGDLSTSIERFQTQNDDFDKQIAKIEEKVARESERLVKSFGSMEKIIADLQSQGNVLSSSLSAIQK